MTIQHTIDSDASFTKVEVELFDKGEQKWTSFFEYLNKEEASANT